VESRWETASHLFSVSIPQLWVDCQLWVKSPQ
jgi:hypothetical protein